MEECAGVTVSLVGIRQDRAGVRAGAKGAEQLVELGKGLEGIPLTPAGRAQYLIENPAVLSGSMIRTVIP